MFIIGKCSISMPLFSSNWVSRGAMAWEMSTVKSIHCRMSNNRSSKQTSMPFMPSVPLWLWWILIKELQICMCPATSSLMPRCQQQFEHPGKCGDRMESCTTRRRSFQTVAMRVSIRQQSTSVNSTVRSM